ncbi:MAG: DUF4381 family protein [Zetaproteobacteria bacterium]|nr:DUF4381 family protein [Zetaproteobacteria bacterium]
MTHLFFIIMHMCILLCAGSIHGVTSSPVPPHEVYSYITPHEPLFTIPKWIWLITTGVITIFLSWAIWYFRYKADPHYETKPSIEEQLEQLNPEWRHKNTSIPVKEYAQHLHHLLSQKIKAFSRQETSCQSKTGKPRVEDFMQELEHIQFSPIAKKVSHQELYQKTQQLFAQFQPTPLKELEKEKEDNRA